MGRIYNGGNNYGEDTDTLDTIYLNKTEGALTYLSKADASSTYATKSELTAVENEIPDVSGFLTEAEAEETYMPLEPGYIYTLDIENTTGHWGEMDNPEPDSTSLDETISYLKQHSGGSGGDGSLTISNNDLVVYNGYWGNDTSLREYNLSYYLALINNLDSSGLEVVDDELYAPSMRFGDIHTGALNTGYLDVNEYINGDCNFDITLINGNEWGSNTLLETNSLKIALSNIADAITNLESRVSALE